MSDDENDYSSKEDLMLYHNSSCSSINCGNQLLNVILKTSQLELVPSNMDPEETMEIQINPLDFLASHPAGSENAYVKEEPEDSDLDEYPSTSESNDQESYPGCSSGSSDIRFSKVIFDHANILTENSLERSHPSFDAVCEEFMSLRRNDEEIISGSGKNFSCTRCRFKSDSKDDFKTHLMFHTIGSFQCETCSKDFKTFSDLKKHRLIHLNTKMFSCSLCAYQSNRKCHLKEHEISHGIYQPIVCSLCGMEFKRTKSLRRHEDAAHLNVNLFRCHLCRFVAHNKESLKLHDSYHSGTQLHKCSICSKEFQSKKVLRRHEWIHAEVKRFECTQCDYKTNRKSHLKGHELIHKEVVKLDKTFKCDICGFATSLKRYLIRHLSIHSGEQRFQCTDCSYNTNYKSRFTEHVAIHTGEKPFSCSMCKFKTVTLNRLKYHETSSHIKKKRYTCNLCDYSCVVKRVFEKHIASHLPESASYADGPSNDFNQSFSETMKASCEKLYYDDKSTTEVPFQIYNSEMMPEETLRFKEEQILELPTASFINIKVEDTDDSSALTESI